MNICDISVHFFIISPISFHAENNPDQLNTFLTLIDGGCDELNKHGGVLCTFGENDQIMFIS